MGRMCLKQLFVAAMVFVALLTEVRDSKLKRKCDMMKVFGGQICITGIIIALEMVCDIKGVEFSVSILI